MTGIRKFNIRSIALLAVALCIVNLTALKSANADDNATSEECKTKKVACGKSTLTLHYLPDSNDSSKGLEFSKDTGVKDDGSKSYISQAFAAIDACTAMAKAMPLAPGEKEPECGSDECPTKCQVVSEIVASVELTDGSWKCKSQKSVEGGPVGIRVYTTCGACEESQTTNQGGEATQTSECHSDDDKVTQNQLTVFEDELKNVITEPVEEPKISTETAPVLAPIPGADQTEPYLAPLEPQPIDPLGNHTVMPAPGVNNISPQ